MQNSMGCRTSIILFVSAIILLGCQKEDTLETWTVRGTIQMSDADMPDILYPLSGIKVYLTRAGSVRDTATLWYPEGSILDSAFTDANGWMGYWVCNLYIADAKYYEEYAAGSRTEKDHFFELEDFQGFDITIGPDHVSQFTIEKR